MGDQISCCDAKAQLENTNTFSKSLTKTQQINATFTLPPMSPKFRSIIERAQKTKYFKAKPTNPTNPTNPTRTRQTLVYKSDKQSALYQGEIMNELADGYGTVSFHNGTFFQGCFNRGEPVNGVFVFSDSCYYVGDIQRFQASGLGIYENIQNGYYYEGQWKKNLQHGQGAQKYSNKDEYQGAFMCGSKFGEGEYKFADGRVYKGSFYNGHSDGHGKLTLPNGDSYEGEWKLGKMHGKGIYKWKNGEKYEGDYVNGARQNQGKYVFASGAYYTGGWLNGLQDGEGAIIQGYDEVRGIWQAGQKID